MPDRQTDSQLQLGSLRSVADISLADRLQRLVCAGRIVRSNTAPAHRCQSNSARVRMRAQRAAMLRSRIAKPFVGTLMPV